MSSRILGMGDVLSLIEKAQAVQDDKEAEQAARRLMENKFDLNDMLAQFAQIKKMGGAAALLNMLPAATRSTWTPWTKKPCRTSRRSSIP